MKTDNRPRAPRAKNTLLCDSVAGVMERPGLDSVLLNPGIICGSASSPGNLFSSWVEIMRDRLTNNLMQLLFKIARRFVYIGSCHTIREISKKMESQTSQKLLSVFVQIEMFEREESSVFEEDFFHLELNESCPQTGYIYKKTTFLFSFSLHLTGLVCCLLCIKHISQLNASTQEKVFFNTVN